MKKYGIFASICRQVRQEMLCDSIIALGLWFAIAQTFGKQFAGAFYGVLLFCNTFTPSAIRIVTESADFAARLPRVLRKAFGFAFDQEPSEQGGGKLIFVIEDGEKIAKIFAAFGDSPSSSVTLHVNFGILEEESDRLAFLRGAFLAGGSVTDPAKRYHLELITSHYKVCRETYALLLDVGFSPKELTRGGSGVLYFKQSNYIEDFLTAIGAPVCAMGVMEAKVEKDLRNGVNRRVNCDAANVDKAVAASREQVEALTRLTDAGIVATLPVKLQEVAVARLLQPELSLSELAETFDPPLTKSCLNHRMRKLMELAGKEKA